MLPCTMLPVCASMHVELFSLSNDLSLARDSIMSAHQGVRYRIKDYLMSVERN